MVDKYQKSIKLCVAKSSCRAEIFETLQTYKGFSRVIYFILNGSAILERNETRLERNETRLARNETRGGKLPLSGTVFLHVKTPYLFAPRQEGAPSLSSIFALFSIIACHDILKKLI